MSANVRDGARGQTIVGAWFLSLRSRTLPLACCGIVTGNALAAASGAPWSGGVFWAALTTALCLQLLANLANDYGDYTHAADTPARLGPKRGMHLGLISPAAMKRAIWFAALLAMLSGLVLMTIACRSPMDVAEFLVLGAVSIAAALTYTLGRHAYGYRGLGDLSVLIFFGWVAVLGSYYLQTHVFDPRIFIPATACGLLSVAVLNVNNLRDIDEDRLSGKITFAAMLGMRRARGYHLCLLTAGFAFLFWSACLWSGERPWTWLFLLALPLFAQNAAATLRCRESAQFRNQLAVVIKINMFALGGFAGGLAMSL
ncbi:MAG: 1,4-dihydroxy-2-naphthoate octaprenyltransferase [Azoarcus sp.]|jgi:1,4-dihydroxy-2-naphthoate octaprenyltransferase|nr:1,4-dihydroxy-2-naphthoate octaprenyltransferase [Azoarcus sp.]